MPRDGKNVKASVLAYALIHVYGLKPYFAYLLTYAAFLGITKGKSLTLDLHQICAAPIAHSGAMTRVDPTQQGNQTDGQPSVYLVNQMMDSAEGPDFDLDKFAFFRVIREQNRLAMPFIQRYIAADELGLMLLVFGNRRDNYAMSRQVVYDFLAYERLPDDWRPSRSQPLQRSGLGSTIHVGHLVLKSMCKQRCQMHIPYYVLATAFLSVAASILFIMKSNVLELPSLSRNLNWRF